MIEVGEDKGMQQPRENKQKTRDERIALLMQHLIQPQVSAWFTFNSHMIHGVKKIIKEDDSSFFVLNVHNISRLFQTN